MPSCAYCKDYKRICIYSSTLPSTFKYYPQYLNHFIQHCCKYLLYPSDDGNPFLVAIPFLARTSPALCNSMVAIAAGHLSRTGCNYGFKVTKQDHKLCADWSYAFGAEYLGKAINDETKRVSDSTLAACLLLCIYEVISPIHDLRAFPY